MIRLLKTCAWFIAFSYCAFLYIEFFMHGGLPWSRGDKLPIEGLPLIDYLFQLFLLLAISMMFVAVFIQDYRSRLKKGKARLTIEDLSSEFVELDDIPDEKLKYLVNEGTFIKRSGIIFDEKNMMAHFVSCHCRNDSLIPQIFNANYFSCAIKEIRSFDYDTFRDHYLISTVCGICSIDIASDRLPERACEGRQAQELNGSGLVQYLEKLGIPEARLRLKVDLAMLFFVVSSFFGLLAGAAFSTKYLPPGNSSIAMGCAFGAILFGSLSPLVFRFLKIKLFPILNFKLIVINSVFFAAGSFVGLLVNLASKGPEGVGQGNLEMICGLAGLLLGLWRRR